ncbi:potassium/proton antiporter [Arthrobacter sp. AET 35A]|uniref:potassium/proton antiporter n=1 Tax=Arthrobacter sp. AET 35A TaxID=2292643 RepID=UPI001CE2FB9E|nr:MULTISPECIES: potassium/proton antiporter [unclassified Arthrobacter]
MDLFNLTLVGVSLLVLIAVAAVGVSRRAGLPALLIYIALGLIVGEAGFGLRFDDAELTQVLGFGLLAIVLTEGGLTTRWTVIKPVLGVALALSTLGVVISVGVTALLTYWVLGVDVRTALLLGTVVSSTDAAAVFSVMRRLPLRARPKAILEAESGLNDAPVVIVVSLLVSDSWATTNGWLAAAEAVFQLVAGGILGFLIAWFGKAAIRRTTIPAAGLYPIAVVFIALLSFGVAGLAGLSSFAAVYVAALKLGNANLPHARSTRGFAESLAWLAQIALFVLLGLLASPARLTDALLPALVVGSVLLLVARPLSIVIASIGFGLPWQEKAFLSWAGLRGAVPIVLATIPISAGISEPQKIFDIVFVLVVIFTLVQAPVLPRLVKILGLGRSPEP